MAATTIDDDNPNNLTPGEYRDPLIEHHLLDAPSEAEKMERFQQKLNTSLISLGKQKRKLKLYYNALFSIALISGISATLLAGMATGSKAKCCLEAVHRAGSSLVG